LVRELGERRTHASGRRQFGEESGLELDEAVDEKSDVQGLAPEDPKDPCREIRDFVVKTKR
jgi:hypothetical protein